MMKMIRARLVITGCAFAVLLVLAAVSPRPARPAVPARPVGGGVLSGRVICVDAGHGGHDGGARARDSMVWEREINLSVATKVKAALEEAGAQVILTRQDASAYSDNKREDLTMRLQLAEENGAELLLSIHMNEFRSRKESGPQVFYRAGDEKGRLLAGALQSALIRHLDPPKERSALAGDYFILTGHCPAVLVECGFLSNSAEEKLLLTESYQQLIAEAVCAGVADYFALTP